MKDLIQSLIYIQQHLIVPKDQFNSFGKYNYRSLESILAAIKPLLRSQNCGIRFEDEVIELGGRTFLKTTLYFFMSIQPPRPAWTQHKLPAPLPAMPASTL